MKARWLLTAVLMAALVVPLPSQGGGVGTRLDEFGGKLRLHPQNQMPALQQIFAEGGKEAAPVAQEMLQLRQTLLNLTLANRTAEIPAARAAYLEAATRMTGVEVAVFQKVYALLQPTQRSRTPDAFAFMAGFFQSAPARGGRGGRGGGAQ
jgi:hypothetical protein